MDWFYFETEIDNLISIDLEEKKLLKNVALSIFKSSKNTYSEMSKIIIPYLKKERKEASINTFIHLLETIYCYKLDLKEF